MTVLKATSAFIESLDPDQRKQVQFAFTPQKSGGIAYFHRTADGGVAAGAPAGQAERAGPFDFQTSHPDRRGQAGPGEVYGPGGGPGMGPPGGFVGERYGEAVWSNFPVSDVPRPGLRLGSLTAVQRRALMLLLQSVLSPMGYRKVLDIMGSDQALADAGTDFAAGEAVYTIAILGKPSARQPWMLEFGGHHLGLNIVIAGPDGVMTPTLTGAQPTVYKQGSRVVRALAQENDTAFAFMGALTEAQRKVAVLNYQVNDLVLGPGQAGKQLAPEGIAGSSLDGKRRAMLLDVIAQWAGIVNDVYAKPRIAEIQSGLNQTYFAWSGPPTHESGKNGSSYYRIQGPRLLIEFSPQGVGGDPTMHVHTIYRDPTNDYGLRLTGAH